MFSSWRILIFLFFWRILSSIFSCCSGLSLGSCGIKLCWLGSFLLLSACRSICLSIGISGNFLLSRLRLLINLCGLGCWLVLSDLLSVDVLLRGSHVAIISSLVIGGCIHHRLLVTIHASIHLLIELLTHAIHVLLLLIGILTLVRVLLLITIHVHSICLAALDRCKCSWWSSHSQLLVLLLREGELFATPSNRHVHQLHFLALLVLEVLIVATTMNATFCSLEYLNLLAVLVLLFSHLVDALDQVDVVLHETRVVLTVLLEITRQLLAIVADMRFMSLSLTCMLSVGIDILSLSVSLFQNPSLIKSNDTLLEFFVVSNVLNNLKDVILEALLLQ